MTKLCVLRCGEESGTIELQHAKYPASNEEYENKHSFFQKLKNYVAVYCSEGSLHGIKYLGEKRTCIENICNCATVSGEVDQSQPRLHNDKKQIKGYTFSRNLKNYISEYCADATLHGVKYLGQERTTIEKIWWLISMIVALYLCISLVLNAYDKWQNAPVIVSFATKETPNWQTPFPVITICPETKALPKKFNFSHYLQLKRENKPLTPEEDRKFEYASLLCNYQHDVNYSSLQNKFAGQELYEFFDEVQPSFFDMISECKYMGVRENCSDLFTPVITDDGVCYTFNLLDRSQILREDVVHFKNYHMSPLSNWTSDHGYPLSEGKFTYPRRALFAGVVFALEGKLTVYDEELDYVCGSSTQGFKIQVSHPSELPRARQNHFKIPLDQAVMAGVSAEMTTTSEAVQKYNPKKRNCYFPNERKLKYFKVYSQQNCQIECKTNYTIEACGCVHYYMPRNNDTQVCTGGKLDCVYDSERELMLTGTDKKLEMLRLGTKAKHVDKCDCAPICTSTYYIVESSQSNWEWRKQYKSEDGKHMSYFQVFCKAFQFVTLERNELFGATDFLANFGGLLGLFIGFSLLSLIELIYYASLRIICNIILFGKRNWSGKVD